MFSYFVSNKGKTIWDNWEGIFICYNPHAAVIIVFILWFFINYKSVAAFKSPKINEPYV
jgi:hypothetical protein